MFRSTATIAPKPKLIREQFALFLEMKHGVQPKLKLMQRPDLTPTPTGLPSVVQIVRVEAKGFAPREFRLIWDAGNWRAYAIRRKS